MGLIPVFCIVSHKKEKRGHAFCKDAEKPAAGANHFSLQPKAGIFIVNNMLIVFFSYSYSAFIALFQTQHLYQKGGRSSGLLQTALQRAKLQILSVYSLL